MMAQTQMNFAKHKGQDQADTWRRKELIFAQGLINLMERLGRKDARYLKILKDFAKQNAADPEIDRMIQDAFDSLKHYHDEAALAASEDI